MWWFVGGYLLTAAVFYAYIIRTAQEDPYEGQEALGAANTSAGRRPAAGASYGLMSSDHAAAIEKKAGRAA